MKATRVVLLVLVLGMTAAACNNSNSSLTAHNLDDGIAFRVSDYRRDSQFLKFQE